MEEVGQGLDVDLDLDQERRRQLERAAAIAAVAAEHQQLTPVQLFRYAVAFARLA